MQILPRPLIAEHGHVERSTQSLEEQFELALNAPVLVRRSLSWGQLNLIPSHDAPQLGKGRQPGERGATRQDGFALRDSDDRVHQRATMRTLRLDHCRERRAIWHLDGAMARFASDHRLHSSVWGATSSGAEGLRHELNLEGKDDSALPDDRPTSAGPQKDDARPRTGLPLGDPGQARRQRMTVSVPRFCWYLGFFMSLATPRGPAADHSRARVSRALPPLPRRRRWHCRKPCRSRQ
jgi:hypothetical protein